MNIKEFISYKTICPFCDSTLKLCFLSKRKQILFNNENTITVIFDLNPINKSQKLYRAGFNFNIINNTFYIEFYNKSLSKIEDSIPTHLINRLKDLLNNISDYQIYKTCNKCDKYNYSSNVFKIDLRSRNIGNLSLHSEFFEVIQPITDGYKIYELYNRHDENHSFILYKKSKFENKKLSIVGSNGLIASDGNYIKTNLIKISDTTKLSDKLSKIITFS
jgi:hypothetical protein